MQHWFSSTHFRAETRFSKSPSLRTGRSPNKSRPARMVPNSQIIAIWLHGQCCSETRYNSLRELLAVPRIRAMSRHIRKPPSLRAKLSPNKKHNGAHQPCNYPPYDYMVGNENTHITERASGGPPHTRHVKAYPKSPAPASCVSLVYMARAGTI